MLDVKAINRHDKLALMSDDMAIPITNFLDDDGDECGPDSAVVFIAGPDANGKWHTARLDDYESARVH